MVEEIKSSPTSLSKERNPFTFDDDRKRSSPPGPRPSEEEADDRATCLREPPETPVGQQEPVSMTEAMKIFDAGQLPSPYVGDTPKVSTIRQTDNKVKVDNLVGHDAHAPAPLVIKCRR